MIIIANLKKKHLPLCALLNKVLPYANQTLRVSRATGARAKNQMKWPADKCQKWLGLLMGPINYKLRA